MSGLLIKTHNIQIALLVKKKWNKEKCQPCLVVGFLGTRCKGFLESKELKWLKK